MKKVFYKKLIRDKIPEIIKAAGDESKVEKLSAKRFEEELKKKLIEEAKEVAAAPKKEIVNELADVLEIFKSIASHYKIRFSKIEKLQLEKKVKRGGFKKKLFLVWSTEK